MRSLKSKKVSWGIVVALLSLDWYVAQLAMDNYSADLHDSPDKWLVSQPLPALKIVQVPAALASNTLFPNSGNGVLTFQELQTLAFTVPIQLGLAQLSTRDSAQQAMQSAQEAFSSQTMPETVTVDTSTNTTTASSNMESVSDDALISTLAAIKPLERPAPAKKANTLQADNLIKLLALYAMMHR